MTAPTLSRTNIVLIILLVIALYGWAGRDAKDVIAIEKQVAEVSDRRALWPCDHQWIR